MFKLQHAIGWRMMTAILWAAVVVSGWYWTQAVVKADTSISTDAPRAAVVPDMSNPAALARLLGATPPLLAEPGPGPSDRFVLSGVIASSVGKGAALIAVDGKPARPFLVGSELAQGYVLVSVSPREALLAEGINAPVRVVLTLPLQKLTQATSALPGVASAASGVSSPASAPALPAAGVSGIPSLAIPGVAEQVPPVPARADARRQPQTSLGREDRRTP